MGSSQWPSPSITGWSSRARTAADFEALERAIATLLVIRIPARV
jgi:hypothetical protein